LKYTPHLTKRFKKDIELVKKQGKNLDKLKAIVELLILDEELPLKNRNHKLIGDYMGHNECHIEPDWLLIYRIENDCIFFERTGSHSNLFR
jgi:mRNA interferase YafQ